jgi:hypothetical protein
LFKTDFCTTPNDPATQVSLEFSRLFKSLSPGACTIKHYGIVMHAI